MESETDELFNVIEVHVTDEYLLHATNWHIQEIGTAAVRQAKQLQEQLLANKAVEGKTIIGDDGKEYPIQVVVARADLVATGNLQ